MFKKKFLLLLVLPLFSNAAPGEFTVANQDALSSSKSCIVARGKRDEITKIFCNGKLAASQDVKLAAETTPNDQALSVVVEFMVQNGFRPISIEWMDSRDSNKSILFLNRNVL